MAVMRGKEYGCRELAYLPSRPLAAQPKQPKAKRHVRIEEDAEAIKIICKRRAISAPSNGSTEAHGGPRNETRTFATEHRPWLCAVFRYPDGHAIAEQVVVVARNL